MNVLVVLNDQPYGSERSYNGLRLALALSKNDNTSVRVFLIGDAVSCAAADQCPPTGYYNVEKMIGAVVREGGEIACCGSCLEARGIRNGGLCKGAHPSSMKELAAWVVEADRIVTF